MSAFVRTLTRTFTVAAFAATAACGIRSAVVPPTTPAQLPFARSTTVFVLNGNGTITQYRPNDQAPARRISRGVGAGIAMAVDRSSNLFVLRNYSPVPYACQVTVLTAPSYNVTRNLTVGCNVPQALVFDRAGNLYVLSGPVTVFAPGSSAPARIITSDLIIPVAAAFDTADNLYVADLNWVNVYAAESVRRIRTITTGISCPSSLAIDASDTLFVANVCSNAITVYAPGSSRPVRRITAGIAWPQSIALDASGNLYVANLFNTVTVYPRGSVTPSQTLTHGIWQPLELVLDASGNLYVANAGYPRRARASVAVFSTGERNATQTIERGVDFPRGIALSP